jgi:8-oxo-dGTP pyrophosphatase MutT (NUDIX family)
MSISKFPMSSDYKPSVIGQKPDKVENFRENVRLILYNPKTNKYLMGYKNIDMSMVTIGGGIEKGQSIKEAIQAEIREETGYTDYIIVKNLGQIRIFATNTKNENLERLGHGFLIILNSEDKLEIQLTEKEIEEGFYTEWQTATEIIHNFEIAIQNLIC